MPHNAFPLAGALLAALLLAAEPAAAQQRQAGPRPLGTHGAWTAATHQENGQKVCYAFARPARSEGAPANRGTTTLTVAHRANGRDQVAVSTGFALPRGAEAVMTVGTQEARSYAALQSNAFFQGASELIAAFRAGREAVVRSPAPTGRGTVTDSFPLSGFTAAYEAISRECPARAAR